MYDITNSQIDIKCSQDNEINRRHNFHGNKFTEINTKENIEKDSIESIDKIIKREKTKYFHRMKCYERSFKAIKERIQEYTNDEKSLDLSPIRTKLNNSEFVNDTFVASADSSIMKHSKKRRFIKKHECKFKRELEDLDYKQNDKERFDGCNCIIL